MKVVDGDLLDVTEGLIAHQVNCRGVMGAGVARVIAKRYPKVEDCYRVFCRELPPVALLGRTLLVRATDVDPPERDLLVANVFGQLDTGRGLQTDYSAVRAALVDLSDWWDADGARVWPTLNVPYMMGCGLAGGDWDVYSAILDEQWPGDVVAHRLVPR